MRKQLFEQTAQSGLSVDKGSGLITGVKVLGLQSVNRRRYTTEAVKQALPKYEGIKVNIDHPQDGPREVRSLRDRIGKLINVRMEANGLWGDLLYNPAHPLAETVAWWAEHQPDCLGLSHNAIGEGRDEEDGTFVVEKIVDVRSVDIVADPATTKGLYECDNKETMDDQMNEDDLPVNDMPADEPQDNEDYETHIGHLVVAVLQDEDMSKEEKKQKILQALKLLDDDEHEDSEEAEDENEEEAEGEDHDEEDKDHEECVQHLRKSKDKHVKKLLQSYTRIARENRARQMCEAAHVPTTEIFIEGLVRAKDEQAMRALIEDRKAVVNRPRSAGRVPPQKITVAEFASAIKECE